MRSQNDADASLIYQWTFDTDDTDSVGGATMILLNGASIDNSTFFSGGGSLDARPSTFNTGGYAARAANIHFDHQFTIVLWSLITTTSGFQTFMPTAPGNTGSLGFKLFSGRIAAQSLVWEAGGNDETATGVLGLSSFHQIVTSVDKVAGTVDYYLDGVLIRNGSTTNIADDRPLFAGAFSDGLFSFHSGWIDDIQIYNTRLSGAEIAALNQPRAKAPEPATLALFGLGLAGLSFARRRTNA